MVDRAVQRLTITASSAECYAVAADLELYPEWASDIEEAVVLQRDAAGAPTLVRFQAAALGRRASYTLAYNYAGAPDRLEWRLEAGEAFVRLEGSYRFEPIDDDQPSTEVTYELAVELAIHVPAFVRRRAEDRIMRTALPDLRDRVEDLAVADG